MPHVIVILETTVIIDCFFQVTDETFDTKIQWGVALTEEHERSDQMNGNLLYFLYIVMILKFAQFSWYSYLVDEFYKKPIIIYDHPKELKPFNVRINDDGKTVAAFDVIVPKVSYGILRGVAPHEHLKVCLF